MLALRNAQCDLLRQSASPTISLGVYYIHDAIRFSTEYKRCCFHNGHLGRPLLFISGQDKSKLKSKVLKYMTSAWLRKPDYIRPKSQLKANTIMKAAKRPQLSKALNTSYQLFILKKNVELLSKQHESRNTRKILAFSCSQNSMLERRLQK